jgi:GLPGLI family protein
MKFILLKILFLGLVVPTIAQSEGTITYSYNRKKLGIRLESQLKFKGTHESVYIQRNEEETFQHVELEGETTTPRRFDDWYINTKIKQGTKRVYLKDGTKLYASFEPKIISWEIQDETKTILGYKVQKAVAKQHRFTGIGDVDYGDAIAWFALDLPNSSGPKEFWGLPGIILELGFSKLTSIVIIAENIKLEPVGKLDVNDGILVTIDQIEDPNKINTKWLKRARELLNNDN